MNVLLIGSGAREHAIAWKLGHSPRLTSLITAPGNAGTATISEGNVPVNASDIEGIVQVAKARRVDLVIVGPEDPLSRGLVDRLAVEGIPAFGPTLAAARIESSKAFSKDLMVRHGIPTAPARTFSSRTEAVLYAESHPGGAVVKADGLAAGKGVFVCDSPEEAIAAIEKMMGEEAIFGSSGSTVLIEERLAGRELSAMAFTDGVTVAPMPFSCDYKAWECTVRRPGWTKRWNPSSMNRSRRLPSPP
jgi:phosphoribosylamine--glycine ligase